MKTAVVVGNPRAASRTRVAAESLAHRLGSTSVTTIELAELGASLLERDDPRVRRAKTTVRSSDLVIVASPTYKGTYTGLLKLFLDKFEGETGMLGVVAVPFMLGATAHHALASEAFLRPVLSEIGASCPTPSVYQIDANWETDPGLEAWVERWKPVIHRCITTPI
ncbi:NAD(P)H-dependent oxidoreductase [Arthrobacter bambusae]|uniref:NADPH-dependent FMN reductase n=1 Tax=Arthrobacter bambusae TaxID=1338426 RepID=UPI001F510312|nr:NAD(P)H-dependent oxidoreductase [Arthrobacter bambusae]MCI0144094.1 NAD(P)H-dependent oxidoreductase [Arthrobacter bambusae]